MDCPREDCPGELEYRPEPRPIESDALEWLECDECAARFEVEYDYDWIGDRYVDCSGPGKELQCE
jgi:hypothetical protein